MRQEFQSRYRKSAHDDATSAAVGDDMSAGLRVRTMRRRSLHSSSVACRTCFVRVRRKTRLLVSMSSRCRVSRDFLLPSLL